VELIDGTSPETLHMSPSFCEATGQPQITIFTGGRARTIPAGDVVAISILNVKEKRTCRSCGMMPQHHSDRHIPASVAMSETCGHTTGRPV
jgi:hypothetical protein